MKRQLGVCLLASGLLGACASNTIFYKGSARPLNEVALIKAVGDESGVSADLYEYSIAPYDAPSYRFSVPGSEVRMDPGNYRIRLGCSTGRRFGRPSVDLAVRGGTTYELGCAMTGMDEKHVRVRVLKIYPTETGK